MNRTRVLSGVIAAGLGVLVIGTAIFAHTSAQNDTEVVEVALDPANPANERLGYLVYRGGLDIPPMGQNIGGLSALRWDAQSGRLLALTDDARWVWIDPVEVDGRLTGIGPIETGNLLGLNGEALTGKQQGDSESLTRGADGGWLVGFERDHRVWRYSDLSQPATPVDINPEILLGALDDNSGLEAMAGDERDLVLCAERGAISGNANCAIRIAGSGDPEDFFATPSAVIEQLGGVPTDADRASDHALYILFRSYSPGDGNGASIVVYRENSARHVLMTLLPPLSVDNFEGIAVREDGSRTFLYIVSDDNFSATQRTLLMKFEVMQLAD